MLHFNQEIFVGNLLRNCKKKIKFPSADLLNYPNQFSIPTFS